MMMDQKKPLMLHLLLLLLFFSCFFLHHSVAVPLSRSVVLPSQEAEAPEVANKEMRRLDEEIIARMAIESDDYPGSGANNRHDPRSPGRP
ncbi:uncharacterized protein LOC109719143 [Ananas comosus]|uniref:Uncharacterized protein LOC109719143 n=1 Tax=Ananas comosus TaxID=4615 RepID=A0A6P5FYY0_ANACO|nr:uncharacterized protein LOC109719143 [Ananas comosus]